MVAVPNSARAAVPDAAAGGSKIFVGGLSSETSESDLKEYFSVYGELTDIVVMRGALESCTKSVTQIVIIFVVVAVVVVVHSDMLPCVTRWRLTSAPMFQQTK